MDNLFCFLPVKTLPHLAVLRSEYNFMDAYEAEGLLGVCVYLVKVKPKKIPSC